jgi:hypothetical protein
LAKSLVKICEMEPGYLVLSAQRYVSGDKAALNRINGTSHRLEVGCAARGHEETELRADRHVGEGEGSGDAFVVGLTSCRVAAESNQASEASIQ